MSLKIITNFHETAKHHGTVDIFVPNQYYDYRGKAEGCYKAAKSIPRKLQLKNDTQSLIEISLNSKETIEYEETETIGKELPPSYEQALLSVHSKTHVDGLKAASKKLKKGEVDQNFSKESSVWNGTYDAAISSLYACLKCVDVVTDQSNLGMNAFANVWPPGHHAEGIDSDGEDIAMGFCYFSNATVAAVYAQNLGFRTLVIDIDNHSGNGTRRALRNKKELAVLDFVYCSPFDERRGGYLDGYFDIKTNKVEGYLREYPYRHNQESIGVKAHPVYTAPNILSLEFTGKEYRDGVNSIEPAATEDEILSRYTNEALPWIKSFDPQLIIWSVGLDSAADDPLGALGFLPSTFYTVIRDTSLALPNAKVMGIMEGGYKAENWTACLWPALLGIAGRTS